MKVKFHEINNHHYSAPRLIKKLRAYCKGQDVHQYSVPFEFEHSEPTDDAFNILLCSTVVDNTDPYDLVLCLTDAEPLSHWYTDPKFVQWHQSNPKVYVMSHSFTPGVDRVIYFSWLIEFIMSHWNNADHPLYHHNAQEHKTVDRKDVWAINGSNRPWRRYFFNNLKNRYSDMTIIDRVHINSRWNLMLESAYQDPLDQEFLKDMNQFDQQNPVDNSNRIDLHDVPVEHTDELKPAYQATFLLPEYFEHRVCVYPESQWYNNELYITEKTLKCFYTGNIPMIIGGQGINKQINKLGFYTAHDMVSESLQWDHMEDHHERYHHMIDIIDLLDYTDYERMALHNFQRLHTWRPMNLACKEIIKLIKS